MPESGSAAGHGADSSGCRSRQHPVRTIGKVAAIDTLPTGNDALRIVLFNDNTWRYVLSQDYVQDTTVFADHWNTSSIHAYNDVELSSLPEAAAIMLVDSLKSYHYPYLGRMSSRYGLRRGRPHQGVDLPLKTGDPIYAAFDGKVRYSGYNGGGYGNLVVIRHTNGLETYYGHLSERGVEAGDWVVAGQQIGCGGSTGRSSGPTNCCSNAVISASTRNSARTSTTRRPTRSRTRPSARPLPQCSTTPYARAIRWDT